MDDIDIDIDTHIKIHIREHGALTIISAPLFVYI